MESIGISPNWARKIRGRKVKGEEAPYSRPLIEQLRAKYAEAVPLLGFINESSIDEKAREAARQEFLKLLTPEQRTLAERGHMRFSRVKKEKKITECTDGEHCQKVCEESELPSLLTQGWKASIVLPSGKVVVEK